jgi:hypothetical protein
MKTDMMQLLLDCYEYLTHYEDTFPDKWRSDLIDRVLKAMNELEEL